MSLLSTPLLPFNFGRRMLASLRMFLFSRKDPVASGNPRAVLSARYIRGNGIEIGALHNPLWVPPKASVTYVDRIDKEELARHYPEIAHLITKLDVIDNGERLTKFAPNSQDFIIANHFIEHTQDPIGTIRRHLEVLRPGGILFMVVPDKRYTFDRARPETDFAHVLRDYREGPELSYESHLREFASFVQRKSGDDLEAGIKELKETNYSIHFHVWAEDSFRDFLDRLITEIGFPMQVVRYVANKPQAGENICIIRRTQGPLPAR